MKRAPSKKRLMDLLRLSPEQADTVRGLGSPATAVENNPKLT